MSGKLSFTPEQTAAIWQRGGPLLVSAAAGSGKTKVLVSRLLSYITDADAPCGIGDFLVITYTRAAAAELRSKIRDELAERLAAQPDDRHLRRQTALVHSARIGTIHSFCTELLRENAQLAALPPDFRVADENECRILKARVLGDVLDQRYETVGSAPGFKLLADTLSAGRDDSRLVEVILDAHAKLKSHADPEGWAGAHLEALRLKDAADASETLWGRYLMADARDKAAYWRGVLSGLLTEAAAHPDFLKAYGGSVAATADSLGAFLGALDTGWDAARACAQFRSPGRGASGDTRRRRPCGRGARRRSESSRSFSKARRPSCSRTWRRCVLPWRSFWGLYWNLTARMPRKRRNAGSSTFPIRSI
jgi:ATP-dependent helicase/nuclease subunit A